MSTLIISQQKVYWGGYDITGNLSSLALNFGAATPDATALGDTTRKVSAGGLFEASFSHEGYVDGGDTEYSDKLGFDAVGTGNLITVCVQTGAYGEVAYFTQNLHSEMSRPGTLGEVYKFSANTMPSSGRVVRGTVMVPKSTITATGDGTARQLGAVTATQKVYAALHVFSSSGTSPTLDVTVESAPADAWVGAQTTRLTLTQATGITAELKSVAGAITDEWWRVAYAIGGTATPTFSFAVVVGIL